MDRMTGSDYCARIRRALGDPSTGDWSDDDSLRCVWEAMIEVAAQFAPPELRTYYDITTVANTAEYTISHSGNLVRITEVRNQTTGKRLERTTEENYFRDVQTATIPTGYVYRYWESGPDKITLQFTPSTSGDTIRVWYIAHESALVTTPTPTGWSYLKPQWDKPILQRAIKAALAEDQQRSESRLMAQEAAESTGIAVSTLPRGAERRWPIVSKIAKAGGA